jgi:hypothetical protein
MHHAPLGHDCGRFKPAGKISALGDRNRSTQIKDIISVLVFAHLSLAPSTSGTAPRCFFDRIVLATTHKRELLNLLSTFRRNFFPGVFEYSTVSVSAIAIPISYDNILRTCLRSAYPCLSSFHDPS